MANHQVQEMTATQAYEKMQAESAKNQCVVTGMTGAQYAVYVKDGKLGGDGKPRFSHTCMFVIRTKKKGLIVPDAESEDPAERLAAKLKADGLEFEIRPTYWLTEFFRINKAEQDQKTRRGAEAQQIGAAFASFKKPVAQASVVETKSPVAEPPAPAKVVSAETPPTPEQTASSPLGVLAGMAGLFGGGK